MSDSDFWSAILRRDASFDGWIFYSVSTTGIYCRPSCPARRPLLKNVAFHASCAAAEAAGCRPCQRCKPRDASLRERHTGTVAAACRMIETAEAAPSLTALAKAIGYSRSAFQRMFKSITGVTPKAYASALRQYRLREGLVGATTVTQAFLDAGFNSSSRFYAKSKGSLGMTATAYRSGGAQVTLKFAVGECSLGSILVAMCDVGIAAILLGDEPEALIHDLENRFPHAELIGDDPTFETLVAAVVGLVEAPHTSIALPLDIRGTVFQMRVWQALRDIPAGSTMTYKDVAQHLGAPKAARAIAAACAANALAVAIPCHRIIKNDGTISGYRWGVDRKRALLARETVQHCLQPRTPSPLHRAKS